MRSLLVGSALLLAAAPAALAQAGGAPDGAGLRVSHGLDRPVASRDVQRR